MNTCIESGYDGVSRASWSSLEGGLILDPETTTMRSYWATGPLRPESTHSRRELMFTASPQLTAAALESWVREHDDELKQLASMFEETRWNGRRHSGIWRDGYCEIWERLQDSLLSCEGQRYADADEYIDYSIAAELVELGSVAAAVEEIVQRAMQDGWMLHIDDVRSCLDAEIDP